MILEIRCFLRDRKIIDYLQDRLETARKVLIAPLASPHGPRFLLGYPIDRHPFQISQISGGRDSGNQIQTDSLLWEKGIQVRHSTHCLWAHFLAIHHRSGSVPSPHPPLDLPFIRDRNSFPALWEKNERRSRGYPSRARALPGSGAMGEAPNLSGTPWLFLL